MRIGIDCRISDESSGVGHYTLHLVRNLAATCPSDQFVLFFYSDAPAELLETFSRFQHVRCVRLRSSRYRRFLPFIYSHVVVPLLFMKERLDLFHAPANVLPLLTALLSRRPSVVTVHDLAIYEHPEWFRKESGFSQRVLVPLSLKKATRILAVSQATAAQITSRFPFAQKKIDVIHEGVDAHECVSDERVTEIKNALQLPERFLLFVGTVEPRKNLARLITAFDEWKTECAHGNEDVVLVIAGRMGWKVDTAIAAAETATWKQSIRFVGHVTEEQKRALMQACTVFVFPSMWEGFGLPVLEAAASGAPVLTSRVSALPEVCGDAAVYVDPEHISSIKQGVAQFMGDAQLRRSLRQKGMSRAAASTWKTVATKTRECYTEAVHEG